VTRPFIAFDPQTRLFIGYGILVVSTTLLLSTIIHRASPKTIEKRRGDADSYFRLRDITTVIFPKREATRSRQRSYSSHFQF